MNATAKHTPGPWFTTPTSGLYGHVSTMDCGGVNDGGDVATTWGKNAKANARLMAASPDLLEALKNVIDSIEIHDDRAVELALAAIAKAEGRSNA